jgi:hypothetical protein
MEGTALDIQKIAFMNAPPEDFKKSGKTPVVEKKEELSAVCDY